LDALVGGLHKCLLFIHWVCLLVVAVASTSALVGDSGEAEVEVPEAVTVEVEEIHPLPEVSAAG